MEAQKEPSVGLKGQPQPGLLAPYLNPSLIHQEASNPPNREAIIQMAESLNPIPDCDMAPRAKILKARGHRPQTQTAGVNDISDS